MSAAESFTPVLRICSCSGSEISKTNLDTAPPAAGTPQPRARLVTMGWTNGEMLVIVRERGGVEVFDVMVRDTDGREAWPWVCSGPRFNL